MEFPTSCGCVAENQFDTIYHEHYSYLSLHAVLQVFAAHGLTVFDVEEPSLTAARCGSTLPRRRRTHPRSPPWPPSSSASSPPVTTI